MREVRVNWRRRKQAGLAALAVALSCTAPGQTISSAPNALAADAKMQTEALLPPLLIKKLTVIYPTQEIREFGEGWVQLGMMVDTSGKPFEVTVVGSSGDKVFEREAVRAAEQATFQAGMSDGHAIESATQLKIVFQLDPPSTGASQDFIYRYRKLGKSLDAKDKAGADAALKELEVRNLYEDAYYGLATYLYAREWGDETQQLTGLRRAIAFESTAHYLSNQQFRSVLVQCLALEVKQHHYSEAQTLWSKLLRSGIDAATLAKIKPTMQQLDQLRTSEGAYDVAGSMPDGTWGLDLYKKSFRFHVSDGHIAYVKLRCSRGFVRFTFDPAIDYKVNPKYGNCAMELEGQVGTQFTLTQY